MHYSGCDAPNCGSQWFVRLLVPGALSLGLMSFVLGCRRPQTLANDAETSAVSFQKQEVILEQLSKRRSQLQSWALRCGWSVAKDECSVGDAALFNGLLCLSGDALSCEGVRRSQGNDGRMWRSESRIDGDLSDSFSRDMALGVLAYLVVSKDKGLGRRWMTWIEQNDFRLCQLSTDNRCEFTPGFWMLFRDVWSFIGLPLNESMRSVLLEDSVMALLQARFAPPGFEMHLAAVNGLVRKEMGQRSSTLKSLSLALSERQPQNPFFSYLSRGAVASVVEKTLAWCPVERPAVRAEWSFERDQNQEPWQRSMGWECIMLINFLLRDLTENKQDQH